jgi:hypothetical protein
VVAFSPLIYLFVRGFKTSVRRDGGFANLRDCSFVPTSPQHPITYMLGVARGFTPVQDSRLTVVDLEQIQRSQHRPVNLDWCASSSCLKAPRLRKIRYTPNVDTRTCNGIPNARNKLIDPTSAMVENSMATSAAVLLPISRTPRPVKYKLEASKQASKQASRTYLELSLHKTAQPRESWT